MTTSAWFFKNTTRNESDEDQKSFHVAVDFELQSPKESGPKTAIPSSTATPEVDVDFQEEKNQAELENVRLATTPTDKQDTETSNSAGPPGTPGVPFLHFKCAPLPVNSICWVHLYMKVDVILYAPSSLSYFSLFCGTTYYLWGLV